MRRNILRVFLPLLLGTTLVLAGCGAEEQTLPAGIDQTGTGGNQLQQQANAVTIPDFSPIVSEIRPSVVTIDVDIVVLDVFNQPQEQQAAGTGWIFDDTGNIVTNNHVVENADNVTITLSDGRVFVTDSIFTDPLSDLAVVKINARNLTTARTGNTSDLDVGDWVCAIGNSLGLGISATVGVVSALDVSFQNEGELLTGWIQTDAAINPGNSGGPLVDTAGNVIGINSIKIQQTGIEGMGYAISINEALPIIQRLINEGEVIRPFMGITAQSVTPSIATRYGLTVQSGVLVASVSPGSPASAAGLQVGDVILAVGGTTISNLGELLRTINTYEIGDTVSITYWRNRSENTTDITLAASPSSAG